MCLALAHPCKLGSQMKLMKCCKDLKSTVLPQCFGNSQALYAAISLQTLNNISAFGLKHLPAFYGNLMLLILPPKVKRQDKSRN